MQSEEIRKRFGEFFLRHGHVEVPSSSLIPENDPSVLLTTAGMQQFKTHMLGLADPVKDFGSKKLFSSQKSFRTSDIDEVGDSTHHTFFEMLGNFSIGDYSESKRGTRSSTEGRGSYFKEEAIKLAWEFVTQELKIPQNKLFVTVFAGEKDILEDKEAVEIWKKVAPTVKIKKFGKEDNFWGPTGKSGPCGPCSEIHYKNGREEVELWNLVFMEYYCEENGELRPLKQKNIDTGMGLERLARVMQGKNSAYETDLFEAIMRAIREIRKFGEEKGKEESAKILRSERIIGDHIRAAVFLSSDGVISSNLSRGYILRRLIRRAILHGGLLAINGRFLTPIVDVVIDKYSPLYPELLSNKPNITTQIQEEEEKFEQTLKQGLKEFEKFGKNGIRAKEAFDLLQSWGFPVELTAELAKRKAVKINLTGLEELLKKHQETSRLGLSFKGGLAEITDRIIKMHTATHLLHYSLRQVLGEQVVQKGSNITNERLRFDFSYPEKLSVDQIEEVQNKVQEKIQEGLSVKKELMTLEQARKIGAIGLFEDKYSKRVSVYKIGEFSKEFCGGPHVSNTREIGSFKILKEEPVALGVRRIRATIE